ncbi:MAG TPA: hypothetical protein V6D06_04380 [Trichocoleus sp.]
MPIQIEALPGEDLATLAARTLGDPSRFREIANLNGLNPLERLAGGLPINIPTSAELLAQVEPALSSVVSGVESALLQTQTTLEQVSGYTTEAQRLVGEVNGVLGNVESQLDTLLESARQYQGEAVRLVDWLLDKGTAQASTALQNLTEAIRL